MIAHREPLYAKRVESEKAVWMLPDWAVPALVSGSVGDGTILPQGTLTLPEICKVLSSPAPSLTFHLPEVIESNNKVRERRFLEIS